MKPPAVAPGQNKWYSHVHARLLDRIDFEATNQVVATQSPESIVIASRTDPAFAKVPALRQSAGSHWRKKEPRRPTNRARPYEGGMSYAKISRLDLEAARDPGRDAHGLRRARRLVPGRSDPALEVQRRRPGPGPKPQTRARQETGELICGSNAGRGRNVLRARRRPGISRIPLPRAYLSQLRHHGYSGGCDRNAGLLAFCASTGRVAVNAFVSRRQGRSDRPVSRVRYPICSRR